MAASPGLVACEMRATINGSTANFGAIHVSYEEDQAPLSEERTVVYQDEPRQGELEVRLEAKSFRSRNAARFLLPHVRSLLNH